jgi:hypothetical protein
MLKNFRKKAVSAVCAAVLLCSSAVPTFADNTVRIVVDGQEIIPTDANGNVVEPIIINGTTYLPVRAVAEAFGKAVSWDGPSYTVYLGDMGGDLEYPTVELQDMTSISDKPEAWKTLTDNYGNRYSKGVIYSSWSGEKTLEYLLNMKYSSLKGTLCIENGENHDGTVYMQVIADGRTIYTSPEMDKTSSPVNVDVNVTGYNDVKIILSSNKYVTIAFADAGFYQ